MPLLVAMEIHRNRKVYMDANTRTLHPLHTDEDDVVEEADEIMWEDYDNVFWNDDVHDRRYIVQGYMYTRFPHPRVLSDTVG